MSEDFTIADWMCATMASTIRDGETVFHGFASPCATVAMHVAKRTHAPNMVLIEGATYALDPSPPFLPPTSNDWSLLRGAAHVLRFEELFDMGARGDLHRMFLSGGQIDPHGNTNVTAIGPLGAPKVKMGGGGGGCNLSATVGALTLWTTRHRSGRTLVEHCDFVTDVGHDARARYGFPGGGPQWLVSELGLFDFADGRLRLRQHYPDVTVDEIRAATAFDLSVADDLSTVPPPGDDALTIIRTLDPLGIRNREFAATELDRRYRFRDAPPWELCVTCL